MRLRILSDLHLEHYAQGLDLPDVEADAVILAGDIYTGTQGLAWAAERFAGMPVLYVPGNHEFYGHSMPALRAEMRSEADRLGVHLLDNSSVGIAGVKFIGTTLWTDFDLYASDPEYQVEHTFERALRVVPDFTLIEQPDGETFTPQESQRLHREAIRWLDQELSVPFNGPKVVISHHAPLPDSIPPRYRGDPLSPAFASRLQHFMGKAALWVHGHVHEPVDLECMGTRVIANPGGYPNEFDPPCFVPDRVIEVAVPEK